MAFSTLAGCTHDFIPNTQVEDSDFNRQVIGYCEDYRRAVERRNIPALLKMADAKYYEDGGTIDTSDDLDLAGLQAYLNENFKKTTQIRYEIFYRDISFGRANQVYVDYTYSASYKVPVPTPPGETPSPDVWRRRVADNRLELVRDGEKFRILAGM
ncbi:MAG: hypothetical protein EOO73_26055 [Myxococcales bacterium]|nr:MAG: hypothetical protein EOO73_26055 [Myxococcales bacterium]